MTADHPIVPVFRSHYSIGLSLLTLEEPGKAKPGNPVSVFDLAAEGGLKEVVVCDDRFDGFVQAHKTAAKVGAKLCYGIRFTVCADMKDKDIESRRTESRAIVFITGGAQGYSDLIRLWNRAWTDGHISYRLGGDEYSYGRLDWALLKSLWTANLALAIPYTGGFIGRNTLTFNRITPDLPAAPWLFREVESELPFAFLLDAAIDRYAAQNPEARVLPTKTVLYRNRADFKAYTIARALQTGGSWAEPNVDHLCSDAFCWEAYRELETKSDSLAPSRVC